MQAYELACLVGVQSCETGKPMSTKATSTTCDIHLHCFEHQLSCRNNPCSIDECRSNTGTTEHLLMLTLNNAMKVQWSALMRWSFMVSYTSFAEVASPAAACASNMALNVCRLGTTPASSIASRGTVTITGLPKHAKKRL